MAGTDYDRRAAATVHVLFGVLLAGTALYLVPTLALNGLTIAAAVAAVVWLGGTAALWFLYRRELLRGERALYAERAAHELLRTFLHHSGEAYLVVDEDGGISFASPNVATVLGADPEHLSNGGGIIEMVRRDERRRVLRAYAALRRRVGATVSLEIGAWHPDGSECYLDIRATNLMDSPAVQGILVTIRDITPRKSVESEIRHLAYHDALTGLANRRFFFEQGERVLGLARRKRHQAAVLYIDVDRFKQVNDLLGPSRGDDLLKEVAVALRKSLRGTDILARLGGDEFAVVLSEVRDADAAARASHRLLRDLPALEPSRGHAVTIGASIGVAMFPDDGEELQVLLEAADLAMLRSKTGDPGVQFYRPELRTATGDPSRLEQDMRVALEQHEFQLHYQPVFQAVTGTLAGAEALSRWRHVTRGLVEARDFIRLAERSGLIRSLDRWAIARALYQRRTQLDAGWPGWIAVNLSPQSLVDPELPGYIEEMMEAGGMEPGGLVLELPEATVVRDTARAADLMWELKNTGAAIALDDFGTGATSLVQLRELPIDLLKLHPSFLAGIGHDDGDEQLVEAAVALAHGIRAKVVAKGVERDEQIAWLRDAGCDFIQGYGTGPPLTAEELAAELGRRSSRPPDGNPAPNPSTEGRAAAH